MAPKPNLSRRLSVVPWRAVVRLCRPHVNFVSIHYTYFILVTMVCSVVLWGSSDPSFSIEYVDSLFLVVSAITEAGLNTVDLSTLTTWQQTLLFLLILCGGSIWVSIWLIAARRHSFTRLLGPNERKKSEWHRGGDQGLGAGEACSNGLQISASERLWSRRKFITQSVGVKGKEELSLPSVSADSPESLLPVNRASHCEPESNPLIFLANKSVGRNGNFVNLSREEKKRVSGVEYRALNLLSIVVPLYFALWQLLGCLGLGSWIANNLPGPAVANGINPWWLGIFNGVSAFNNSGMSLLDANLVPYQGSYFVLITMGLMILAGNTAYPVLLRLIFWAISKILKVLPDGPRVKTGRLTVEYVLKYPRRVYTNLFPTRHTWWLAFMVVLLNSVDWTAFELLNIGNPVTDAIPPDARRLDGLFQAIAVRAGGFYVVPIAQLHIGLLVLYVIMMYISAFPVIITMRHSNIHEEKSLGLYSPSAQSSDTEGLRVRDTIAKTGSRYLFVVQQVKGQLAHDIWLLALAVFIITTIEGSNFSRDPVSYSVFNILFEVVSAYGCVGISVGLPKKNCSFAGGWHSCSKLVLCVVMLRGRHRGLPATMDHAVRLAGEHLHEDENEDVGTRRIVASLR